MSKALHEKHVPVPHFPLRISHGLPWVETRVSKVRSLISAVTILTACFFIQLWYQSTTLHTQVEWSEPVHRDVRFFARTSACERRTVLFRNQARRCRSGTLYSSRQTLCRDCQIAFHYTCGKLSGPGMSTKWLLKRNSLSVPFPVGTVSAMSLYQYAV
jgi:hypothetical protein